MKGRPNLMNLEQRIEIRKLIEESMPRGMIRERFGICRGTMWRIMNMVEK